MIRMRVCCFRKDCGRQRVAVSPTESELSTETGKLRGESLSETLCGLIIMREEVLEMKHYLWEVEVSVTDMLVLFLSLCLVAVAVLLCVFSLLCGGKQLAGVVHPYSYAYLDDATTYKFYRCTDPKTPNRRRALGKGRKDKGFLVKDELECITCKAKVPVDFGPY